MGYAMRSIAVLLIVVALCELSNSKLLRTRHRARHYDVCPIFGPFALCLIIKTTRKANLSAAWSILELEFDLARLTKHQLMLPDVIEQARSTMTPVQCVLADKIIDISHRLIHNGFVYSCIKGSNCLTLNVTGCVGEKDVAVPIGDTFMAGDFVFKCLEENSEVVHKAIGCLIDGKTVYADKTLKSRPNWYKCMRIGQGGLKSELIGCVDPDGKTIDAYETYRGGGYLYQCDIIDKRAEIIMIGCIYEEYGVEREVRYGETWYTSIPGWLNFRKECTGHRYYGAHESTHCVVNDSTNNGRKTVEVNCGIKYAYEITGNHRFHSRM
uniref:Abnormal cell migration protein 18-like fibronectin type I domain-containing protein n=1 Tax=Trichuris muris TaxID=70415 RepID=A0A5S6Q092_TRIMR